MIPFERTQAIIDRFQFLEAKMSGGVDGGDIAALAKEYSKFKALGPDVYGENVNYMIYLRHLSIIHWEQGPWIDL